MPERSKVTRQKLLVSGRRHFAEEGWMTARIRDIVADAQQSNDSAINYHFGSRAGLLRAILRIGIEAMEEQRQADIDDLASKGIKVDKTLDVETLSTLVIRPIADVLRFSEGVEFIRIVGQIGPYTRVQSALQNDVMKDTLLLTEVELLVDSIAQSIGETPGRYRIHNFLIALIAILSARALAIAALRRNHAAGEEFSAEKIDALLEESGQLRHDQFVNEVVSTLSAGLASGIPSAR